MIIRRCNRCECLIDRNDPHYSIGDVRYTCPGDHYLRLVKEFGEEQDQESVIESSWVTYPDLDFCPTCWSALGLKELLPQDEEIDEEDDNDNYTN